MATCRPTMWVAGLGLAVLTMSACRTEAPSEPVDEAVAETLDWSYEGETGPDRWGRLNTGFAACGTGTAQSPIDLGTPTGGATAPAVTFDYRDSALDLLNDGHTIQVSYEAGSAIQMEGVRYELKQFQFHGPSEHEVGGKEYPLEIQFVHQAVDGRLAVVAAFADVGARHEALAAIFDNLPTTVNLPRTVLEARIAADQILPRNRSAYHYAGSLTTPPCTEGVRWVVLSTPVSINEKQLEQYRAVMHRNDRPTQPLNGRTLATGGTS